MLLICPSCSTHYEVADEKIPADGRSVKCAACGHSWMAGPWNLSNYAARKSFTPMPSLFHDPMRAGQPGGRYIAQPISASRGGAALAALFDDHLLGAEDEYIDGHCEALPAPEPDAAFGGQPGQGAAAIDIGIDNALSAAPIARLIDQQSRPAAPASPFRSEIAALEGAAQAAAADAKVTAAEADPVRPSATAGNAQTGSYRAGRLLRRSARRGRDFISGLCAHADAILPGRWFRQRKTAAPVVTPGDEKVSEWRARERRRARNRLTPMRFLGWSGWAASVVLILWAAFFYRAEIMMFWPQSQPLYAAIGLPGETQPVILKDISYRYALSDQGPVIELRGAVQHSGDRPVPTPLVRAHAFDAQGRILTEWTFRIRGPRQVLPETELPFLTRSLAPAGVASVSLSVLSEQERAAIELAGREAFSPDNAEAGQPMFFMQKTTVGWGGSESEPPPIDAAKP